VPVLQPMALHPVQGLHRLHFDQMTASLTRLKAPETRIQHAA